MISHSSRTYSRTVLCVSFAAFYVNVSVNMEIWILSGIPQLRWPPCESTHLVGERCLCPKLYIKLVAVYGFLISAWTPGSQCATCQSAKDLQSHGETPFPAGRFQVRGSLNACSDRVTLDGTVTDFACAMSSSVRMKLERYLVRRPAHGAD
jgi:hypothetical protein